MSKLGTCPQWPMPQEPALQIHLRSHAPAMMQPKVSAAACYLRRIQYQCAGVNICCSLIPHFPIASLSILASFKILKVDKEPFTEHILC